MAAPESTPVSTPVSTSESTPVSGLPTPNVSEKPKRNLAWVWLIPLVAGAIGLSIVWRQWATQGPMITITFQSAADLQEGKTQIKFREVVIGVVNDIELSENKKTVIVQARLDKDAEHLAVEGTRFWVVRPSIGLEGISGLSTLLTGAYIEVARAPEAKARALTKQQQNFVGLEKAPSMTSEQPGSRFTVRAPSLGSLKQGTPIHFLRIAAGMVTDYQIDPNGRFVDVDIFIHAPYDKYVNANTRFWSESGISLRVDAGGFNLRTESLVSILAGGLAFATFGEPQAIEPDHRFKLYSDYESAERVPLGAGVPVVMRFEQSARGLKAGASIEFQGRDLGSISRVRLDVDPQTGQFYTMVSGTIYPARLGPIYDRVPLSERTPKGLAPLVVDTIKRGLRAQLKPANLLGGDFYVELIDKRDTPITTALSTELPIKMPTVPSETIEKLQAQISLIIDQIQKIPSEQLANEASQTMTAITQLSESVDSRLAPQISTVLDELALSVATLNALLDSADPLPSKVDASLRQVDQTLSATRALIDELSRKPNAVLFGNNAPSYSRESLGEPEQ
jgi:paraquat-inducible protein B